MGRGNIRSQEHMGVLDQMNIFLVGPMGSGKTTIGKMLAAELGFGFVDSDQHIEDTTGVSIPYIFEIEGEAGFREREEKAIENLTGLTGIVLATGGGAILKPLNREKLKENGIVIYLNVPPESQFERVRSDTQRPLLQTANPQDVLKQLYTVRDPLYRDAAEYIVFSDNIPPKIVVNGIIESIVHGKTPHPEWLVGNR